MKFLFMDECYAMPRSPAPATILTGLLVPAEAYPVVRERFYGLVNDAMDDGTKAIRPMPIVHASELFPELGDNDHARLTFLTGLVNLVLECGLQIYRVGYLKSSMAGLSFGNEKTTIGLCFLGLLWSLEDELKAGPVWPVMETDRTAEQDRQFALQVRNIGYHTSRLGPGFMSVDNTNLGELLYMTKASSLGALVDCVAYLRQAIYLRRTGANISPFKHRLADLGDRLEPVVVVDEVVEMKNHDSKTK